MGIIKSVFGDASSRRVKRMQPIVNQVNALESRFESFKAEDFAPFTSELKNKLTTGKTLDDILPEAFAVAREASKRTLGLRPYDVQLMGGIAIHQGTVTEMRTGEGKTLMETLPVYLNALEGLGVHVVTVNDYLAQRDAVWMGQVYHQLGLTVGVIQHSSAFLYDPTYKIEPDERDEVDEERDETGSFKVETNFLRPITRQEAYAADITYGTNNEFGFDYLRDNMVLSPDQKAQRGHRFAVVDEVDSILIDEARTPLIISAPAQQSSELYNRFSTIIPLMKKESDYEVDEKQKTVILTQAGIDKLEEALNIKDIYNIENITQLHHAEQALRAHVMFVKDKQYVVKEGEVIIVDEFTGRLMPGRRYSDGLHQAIEAKENVDIKEESRTLATITFQNYFRFYDKLSGMTGTAETSSEEFFKVYQMDTVVIPTHREIARLDSDDAVYQTESGKWQALVKEVAAKHEKGQPVLIGTVSIEKNELVSSILKKAHIPFEMLNAKNHTNEAQIIAQAGRKGAITVATNMAGRGVDIKLGGNPATDEEAEEVKRLGGLHVIGTERHDARRIDNQLRGRSGRQGDPGSSQFFVSLEDDMMRVFGGDKVKALMGKFGIPEDQPLENKMVSSALERAQTKIEGLHFDSREHILKYDGVLNKQRTALYRDRDKILYSKVSLEQGEDATDVKSLFIEQVGADDDLKKIIKEKETELDKDMLWLTIRQVWLRSIDIHWMEHLSHMQHARSAVGLRAYGQKDPLVEYKQEGKQLYEAMREKVLEQIVQAVKNVHAPEEQPVPNPVIGMQNLQYKHDSVGQFGGAGNKQPTPQPQQQAQQRSGKVYPDEGREKQQLEVGRNEPCPCGSGKKYKKCGLINAPDHKE